MAFQAVLHDHTLTLQGSEGLLLSVPLSYGGVRRLVVASDKVRIAVLDALESTDAVTVMPADGGVLATLTVGSNLALALEYGQQIDATQRSDWDHALHDVFSRCGLDRQRVASLVKQKVMDLDFMDRWLVGFVRFLLRPPEMLVLDRAFTGASRQQTEALLRFIGLFQEMHPFRPVLYLELDTHELPEVGNCQTHRMQEPALCPS